MFAAGYFAPTYFAPSYWGGEGVSATVGELSGLIAGVSSFAASLTGVFPTWWAITDFTAPRHPLFVADDWRRFSMSKGDLITTARHNATGTVARLPTAWWY